MSNPTAGSKSHRGPRVTKRRLELWTALVGEKAHNKVKLLPAEGWMCRDSESDRILSEPCDSLWLLPSAGPEAHSSYLAPWVARTQNETPEEA